MGHVCSLGPGAPACGGCRFLLSFGLGTRERVYQKSSTVLGVKCGCLPPVLAFWQRSASTVAPNRFSNNESCLILGNRSLDFNFLAEITTGFFIK